ncbi:MAG: helix-turn-helix transcriptional regulator [Candidatus Methanofastidiosa archaeon]|nr:helix-turn-helix transcriptional regulator [Candidatus Methanofastidiosa archaeon]
MVKKAHPEEYYRKLEFIGSLIREYRVNSGYSQMHLAEYLNLSRNSLSRAERGKNITLLSLIELCETLEVDWREVLIDD